MARMSVLSAVAAAAIANVALAAPQADLYTATATASVYAAQATAKTLSPTSHVKGAAFDRWVEIWFENTDYDKAAGDPNFAYFAKKGITLSNYFGVTHPSEPNYMASVGGDYFGLDGDDFTQVPANVSTIFDLLEAKGISWGEYQEDMPYSGFEGYDWVNQETQANDYVRKHNPAVLFNSVANNPNRLAVLKNTTMFHKDLKANKLPQWSFITPNMTSDGHDTSVTVAGEWLRTFLDPLLEDKNFMQNTMVLITFDETETYTEQNRVFSVLLGDAVPKKLIGTTDSNYYNHYSDMATVEANWGLGDVGRWDANANVFKWVADLTGKTVKVNKQLDSTYLNCSYPGVFSSDEDALTPIPATLKQKPVPGQAYHYGSLNVPSCSSFDM